MAAAAQSHLLPSVCHSAVAMASKLTHPDTVMRYRRRRATEFTRHPLAPTEICPVNHSPPLPPEVKGRRQLR